jgi:hypothetical protein
LIADQNVDFRVVLKSSLCPLVVFNILTQIASGGSTLVEDSPANHEVGGSNPVVTEQVGKNHYPNLSLRSPNYNFLNAVTKLYGVVS